MVKVLVLNSTLLQVFSKKQDFRTFEQKCFFFFWLLGDHGDIFTSLSGLFWEDFMVLVGLMMMLIGVWWFIYMMLFI